MSEFRMPSLGADMSAGTVVAWRVEPGAHVMRGDIIAEVETEKGVFEVESPAGGTVTDLAVARGTKVPVGTVLAHIDPERAAAPPAPPPSVILPAAASAPTRAAAIPEAVPRQAEPPLVHPDHRASPLARRVAQDLGVNIEDVTGTGPGGVITRSDVERAATAGVVEPAAAAGLVGRPAAPDVAGPPWNGDAGRRMRHAVAAAVSKSKREIPHYYLVTDVDLFAASAWLREWNAAHGLAERILPAALFLKAVAVALRKHPALNGFWMEAGAQEANGVHVGVAISLRGGGLVAPAIHDADQLPVPELMRQLNDLVRRARTGGLRASEMTDATITVTSLGDEGAREVYGVIYPPQVAIVGFGGIAERPWGVGGMLAVRPVVSITLAADHRATDGHYGGRFLGEVNRLLQTPEAL